MTDYGRLVTFETGPGGGQRYGAVVDGGVADLTGRFGGTWPTLREAA